MGVLRALLDLAWPRVCAGCGGTPEAEAGQVCWNCLASLALIRPPFCQRCGDPVDGVPGGEFVCSVCVDHPPHFERARSAARYTGALENMLQAFKYNAGVHLAPDLAGLLAACVRAHYASEHFDAVTFVPLFRYRERARGYNQARLLAAHLARMLDLPLARRALVRVRNTPTQTRLSAAERTRNVRNAFAVLNASWVKGRRFLLVDDVMTTGATVSECSRVLQRAGAAGVWVVTVARG